jgi:hypothetical protein
MIYLFFFFLLLRFRFRFSQMADDMGDQTDKDKLVCVKTEAGKLIAYDKQLDVIIFQ